MAILNQITNGDILYLIVDESPLANGGLIAPIGSTAIFDNAGSGEYWLKTSAANSSWSKLSTGTAFQPGTELRRTLALTDFNESIAINGTTYVSLGQVSLNKSDYAIAGSTLSFEFDVIVQPTNNNGAGNLRLFNVSSGAIITGSPTTMSGGGNTNRRAVSSGQITNTNWPAGSNIIEFQANDTGSGSWNAFAMQLSIINTF